jgi:F1F0 ATPase subunit 2
MNWAAAAGTGFGLGLAYFGVLWLSVRRLGTGGAAGFAAGRLARLALAAVVFYALLKGGGAQAVLAGLVGLIAARGYLVRRIGGSADGR